MKKLFIFDDIVNDYGEELLFASRKLENSKNIFTITLKALTVDFLVQNSIQVVIANGLSKNWFYVFKGLNIVSIIFDDISKYQDFADIIIDYKSSDNNKYFTGPNFSIKHNPDLDFEEIANLSSIMEWDSRFFGFPVAFIGSMYLSENIMFQINKFIKQEQVKLIEYLCNCHDDRSVNIAEKNAFHFTDIRLTFDLSLQENGYDEDHAPSFGLANTSNIQQLKSLTTNLYKDSRYFYDGKFDLNKINEFYASWIEKAVLGIFDNECYCLFENNNPVAFCTIRYNKSSSANIGLFGVDKNFTGKGLGKKLLYAVFNHLIKKKIKKVLVVTQGRNYSAQRLYQSVGFKTHTTQLWYHKWI